MLVLPKSTSLFSTFHIGLIFSFFPANLMSSTYTEKNILSHGVRISIPIWKLSPNRISIEVSQVAFPIIVLPRDDHTDFAQEGRLGLPYWTMILANCVVVDDSKCLDIPIWEFSIIFGTSSIFTWVSCRYCVCCLSIASWQSGYDVHDSCCCHL